MNPSDYRPAGSSDPAAHPDPKPAALPPIAGEVKVPPRLQTWAIQAGLMIVISIIVALVSRYVGVKIEVPPPPVVVIEGAGPGTVAHVQGGPEAKADAQDRRRPMRDLVMRRLVERAVEEGADRAKAEEVVRKLDGERPILDWLKDGGFKRLLLLVLELIALLG